MRVTGVVLAGGRGERMRAAGVAKPLALHRSRPLLEHAIDAITPLVDELLILHGPEDAPALRALVGARARFVADPGEGPLAALHVAAREAHHPWVLVVPCDAPLLKSADLERLLAACGRDGALFDTRPPQPLVAIYRREPLRTTAEAHLALGERAARSLLSLDVVRIPVADARLDDADTPTDLDALE